MISIQLRHFEPKTRARGLSLRARIAQATGLGIAFLLLGVVGGMLNVTTSWVVEACTEAGRRQALVRRPGDPLAYRAYGKALLRAGKAEGALGAFRGALVLSPNDLEARISLSEALMALGRLSEAERQLDAVLRSDSTSVFGRLRLAEIYTARRQFPSAARTLTQSPNEAPDVRMLVALGETYSRMDEWEKAEEAFRAALRVDPSRARATCGMAQVLAHRGETAEAMRLFQRACSLAPSDPATWHAAGFHALQIGSREGCEQAVQSFTRELRLAPGSAVTYYLLGLAQQRMGHSAAAAETLEAAARLDPGERSIAFEQAKVYATLGEPSKALAAQERFTRLLALQTEEEKLRRRMAAAPPSPAAFVRIASLLQAQGRHDRALWELEQASGIFPNDAELKRRLGALAALRDSPAAVR